MPPKAPKTSRRFQVPETIAKLPQPLPGREAEFATVVKHVQNNVKGSPDSTPILFVSGACGSGKTATISRAEAYLRSLPSIEKTPKDRNALLPVKIQWISINCAGLTLVALMDAIWGAVCSHSEFATNMLKFLKDMFLALGGTVRAAAFLKKYEAGKRAENVQPVFVFALDEAEFAHRSSHPLLSAFTSCAVAFSNQMSLILISNAKSLPFLPLSESGKRSVFELVFESYSVETLKEAVRAHFATHLAPKTLDDVLDTAALDYAVKNTVVYYSADVRKAIALCANAINAKQKKSVTSSKPIGVKRSREENESADGQPAKPQPKATLRTLIGAVTDARSSLDQIQTLSPYTLQLLKCFVECVKKHTSNSVLPRRLQEELHKKTKELSIASKSYSDVIKMLDELSTLGFLTTKTKHEYTLSWSLAELEPKLALIPDLGQ